MTVRVLLADDDQLVRAGLRARCCQRTPTFALDEYVYDALRAGASGFLLKDAPADLLRHAVHAAARREAMLSADRVDADRADRRATPTSRSAQRLRRAHAPRARCRRPTGPRGWSNSEIDSELHVSEATVKSHITPLLAKLGLRDRAQAFVLAHEHGLAEGRRQEPASPTAEPRVDR